MKTLSRTLAATLLAATAGLAAFVPMAQAQQAQEAQPTRAPLAHHHQQAGAPAAQPGAGRQIVLMQRPNLMPGRVFSPHPGAGHHANQHGAALAGARGALETVLSFSGSSQALEMALVRLAHASELTAEQRALFETLRTEALAAHAAFADATESLRAGGDTGSAPDILDLVDTRIGLTAARLDALEAVRPALEAFLSALDADQRAALAGRPGLRQPAAPAPAEPAGEAQPQG